MAEHDALTRDEVLDGLAGIAALEHAHCVYHLRLHYAWGGDPVEGGPAVPEDVALAARLAFNIAMDDMFHLLDVNTVLVRAGRQPVLDRVTSVTAHDGTSVDLHPMTPAKFVRFPQRELELAGAVDRACAWIRLALAVPAPPLEGDLLAAAQGAVERDHAGRIPELADALAGLAPAAYLVVTGVAPADALDQRLVGMSDSLYGFLVALLENHFIHVDDLESPFRRLAVNTMRMLHEANGVLGSRRLLPPFTAP
jgi:hypothetical protein